MKPKINMKWLWSGYVPSPYLHLTIRQVQNVEYRVNKFLRLDQQA